MEFFKKETRIDFMGIRKYTGTLTVVLWILALTFIATKGINLGLDFTGGTQVEVRFKTEVSPAFVRDELEQAGFHGVRVQQYGSTQDMFIRIANPIQETEKVSDKKPETNALVDLAAKEIDTEQKISAGVKAIIQKHHPDAEIRRTEFVGSEVGAKLMEQGGIAILVSILATMAYIAMRFEYRLAVSAAVGLIHDAVLILGVFALFGIEFDLATLASVMAVLGYSLNDTIVVFDRVRENFRKVRKGSPLEIMNLSINQTLSRTIMTSWMTMLVVLALLLFGGESLHGFSMAFFIGIIIGTFSSIYVSGALALWMGLTRADLMHKPKVALDDRP
jgi:preprotein translocase subunit SecF